MLDELAETDEELAEEVRALLFVFEDIVKLDDRAIQMVLREVDQKDLALALRGVADEVKDKILANMSERGAEMLKRGDGVPAAAAQARRRRGPGPDRRVVRRLEEAGAIVDPRGDGEEDEVV